MKSLKRLWESVHSSINYIIYIDAYGIYVMLYVHI